MTHTPFHATGLVLAAALLLHAAEPAPTTAANAVREIEAKELAWDVPRGRVESPTEIKSAEELAKALPDAAGQAKISPAVNFAKEKLLLFAWSGSGQDRLSAAGESAAGKTNVVFTYQPGRTRDLRPHRHLFALPQNATWKVTSGRP